MISSERLVGMFFQRNLDGLAILYVHDRLEQLNSRAQDDHDLQYYQLAARMVRPV